MSKIAPAGKLDEHFIIDQLYDSIKSNKISRPIIFENAIHDAEKMVEIGFGAVRESLLLGHDESSLGKSIEKIITTEKSGVRLLDGRRLIATPCGNRMK